MHSPISKINRFTEYINGRFVFWKTNVILENLRRNILWNLFDPMYSITEIHTSKFFDAMLPSNEIIINKNKKNNN